MKSQLDELKNKLKDFEETLKINIIEEVRESKIQENSQSNEKKIQEILNTKDEEIIKINVGGELFATRLQTLLNVKDNLFYKLIVAKKFDLKKGIFIDRSPDHFGVILDYFRTGKFIPKRFSYDQLLEIKEEALYYELLEIEAVLNKSTLTIEYVKMEVQNPYMSGLNILGSSDPKHLLDKDLTTGVCTSNGYIILELNREVQFDKVEIGGFTGKSDWVYSNGYGAGATIETSVDKVNWKNVGSIPSGFGTTITPVSLTQSTAKYIKLNWNSWIGLGFFKIENDFPN